MKQWPTLLFLAAIGCGGSSKPAQEPEPIPTEPAPPARPLRDFTCVEAQANVAAFTQHVSKTLAATLGAHCAQDRWAQEVINCFASTQSGPELNLCTALLTPEQQRALETQNVADAVDPNAPRDPACAVLDGTSPVPPPVFPGEAAPAVPAAPAAPASKPTPLPTLGLPRGGAKRDPAGPAAPVPAPSAAPAPSRDTIAAKELEALRLSGDPRVAPDLPDQRLVERCNVARVIAALKLCIDTTGTPIVVELLRSSRMPAYDGKLIAAMRTWRYKPYLAEGKPAEVCTAVTFVFALQ
jgi:outer membrane biosynthesis protein TonB